jgi:hexosaminidase
MSRNIAVLFLLAGIIAPHVQAAELPAVVPLPQSMHAGQGAFTLDANTQIYADGSSTHATAAMFGEWLRSTQGLNLTLHDGAPRKDEQNVLWFEATKTAAANVPAEAYRLSVAPSRVHVQGADAGVFYGMQTLKQLLPPLKQDKLDIGAVEIDDAPRFAWRGLHLDVGRHFFPVAFVEKYLDTMATYKLNRFHWHLTEDQGWRIEIKKYPRLTEVGSKRSETVVDHKVDPYVGDGIPNGPFFYTQDQIREVVAYAAARHITVIPEIEMPGHSQAVLAAYPQFACSPGPFNVWTNWGVSTDILCPSDATFAFIDDVLGEVVKLFPAPYIHVGGDEAPKDAWKKSDLAQAIIKREHLKDEDELQSWFIRRVEKIVHAKGKRLIGWDEILEGGIAPDATVMSWRGEQGGIDAAKQGHDVVMSPDDTCYFDHAQGPAKSEVFPLQGYLPLEKVYAYNPQPAALSVQERKHILGVQGNVWSEHMPSAEVAEYAAFPRALALAEVAWSPQSSRDYADFQRRLANQYARLDREGVRYRIPEPQGFGDVMQIDQPHYRLQLASPLPGAAIYYTLDGSLPDPSYSSRYTAPVDVDLPLEQKRSLRVLVVATDGRRSGVYDAVLWNRKLKPAAAATGSKAGVSYAFYDGHFPALADFAKAAKNEPVKRGQTGSFDPKAYSAKENFGLVFDGEFEAPADGVYRFSVRARSAAAVLIDGESIVENAGSSEPGIAQVPLQRGTHHLRVEYLQRTGDANLRLQWAAPGELLRDLDAGQLKH